MTVEADALDGAGRLERCEHADQRAADHGTRHQRPQRGGLATLGLGVSGNLPDSNTPTSVGSSFAISFNGLNQAHNIWLIDGGEAYDRGSGGKSSMMPSQDALGEFQVWPAIILRTTAFLRAARFRCRSRAARRSSTARRGSLTATTLLQAHQLLSKMNSPGHSEAGAALQHLRRRTWAARSLFLTSTIRQQASGHSSSTTKSGARSQGSLLRASTHSGRRFDHFARRISTMLLPAYKPRCQKSV